jgi:hypothetical protein
MMKAVTRTAEPVDGETHHDQIRPLYLEALTMVERLHHRLLKVIKDEFDRRSRADINSVQGLLLYNIGEKEPTAGEVRTRGYYLGSNLSYNLKKLVETGFLDHQRSCIDRRSVPSSSPTRDMRCVISSIRSTRSMCARWSRSVASIAMNSSRSTNPCIGWSDSGPIRFDIVCDGCTAKRRSSNSAGGAVSVDPSQPGWVGEPPLASSAVDLHPAPVSSLCRIGCTYETPG